MKNVKELFGKWVERHVMDGVRLDPRELCGGDEAALAELMRCIAEYDDLQETLGASAPETPTESDDPSRLPQFDGFYANE